METKARVIALYLPQFHPIKENDEVWGKGFTEWTNTVQTVPLFRGHYQPRIPADLGFYDLRLPETRLAQAEMAKESGIEGFCYWHYWFGNGKMVLQRPFREVLESKSPDYPFCLGWANHSWTTKTWEKRGTFVRDEMIMEQQYLGEKDYRMHFEYLLPAFRDKRYIKVEGKPLFYIYNPTDSPEIKKIINLWRKWALESGLPGIFFVGRMHGGKLSEKDILNVGVDAVNTQRFCEAEQSIDGRIWRVWRYRFMIKLGIGFLMKYPYSEISKRLYTPLDKDDNVFPTIIPQFDRSARAGRKARIWYGSTPELFAKQVEKVIELVKDKKKDQRIIFLSSWNEWAEGSYVEPDRRFGWGYLNVLKKYILSHE